MWGHLHNCRDVRGRHVPAIPPVSGSRDRSSQPSQDPPLVRGNLPDLASEAVFDGRVSPMNREFTGCRVLDDGEAGQTQGTLKFPFGLPDHGPVGYFSGGIDHRREGEYHPCQMGALHPFASACLSADNRPSDQIFGEMPFMTSPPIDTSTSQFTA